MPCDIIFDKQTNDILQVFHNPNVIHKKGSVDFRNFFHQLRKKGKNPGFVPWIPSVPEDVLRNPHKYKVKFEDHYSKPLSLMRKEDLVKFPTKFDTKIKDRKILWCGTFYDYISYSNITRDLSFSLFEDGENIKFFSTKSSGEVEIDEKTKLFIDQHMATTKEVERTDQLKIVSYIPLFKIPHSAYNISYTMLETFDTQQEVVDAMNSYLNEIWVPTEYSKKIWSKNLDSRLKLKVMPLWFDEKKFYPGVKPCDVRFECINDNGVSYPETPSGFRFLNIGRYTHRKGLDVLIKSFIEEFSRKDDVSLVLFCRHIINKDEFNKHTKSKLIEIINNVKKGKDSPPIYLNMDPILPEDQGGMYGWGDCFVLPSRGEGFGMPVIESAACKIPVISANHTGLSDFMDESVGWVINTDKVDNIGSVFVTAEGKQKYSGKYPEWQQWITALYNNMLFAVMGRPAIEECKDHMRTLYENNDKNKEEKLEKFHDRVHEKYTWSKCYAKIKTRINEVIDENS